MKRKKELLDAQDSQSHVNVSDNSSVDDLKKPLKQPLNSSKPLMNDSKDKDDSKNNSSK